MRKGEGDAEETETAALLSSFELLESEAAVHIAVEKVSL